jgi:hypothetical protein
MRRILLVLLMLLLFPVALFCQTLTEDWASTYQVQYPPLLPRVNGMAVDVLGNIYISAYPFIATSSEGPIPVGFTTIKYGPDGRQLWLAQYSSGLHHNRPSSMITDSSGNVYVTGSEGTGSTDIGYITIKYDTNGNQLWIAKFSCLGFAQAIALDNSGQVYITGYCYREIGSHDEGIVTIKYDADGNQVWATMYNYALGSQIFYDRGFVLSVDHLGNVVVAGISYVTDGSGVQDTVTIKYDRDGNQMWASRYENTDTNLPVTYPVSIAVNSNNEIYVINRAGDGKCITVNYDSTGTQTWDNYTCPGFSYSNCNQCKSIAVDIEGNLYSRGDVENIGDDTRTELIEKYSGLDGSRLWDRASANFGQMYVDPEGNVYIQNGNVWEEYDTSGSLRASGAYNRQTNLYDAIGPIVDSTGNWYYSGNNHVGGQLSTIKMTLAAEDIVTPDPQIGNGGGGGGGCFIASLH